MVCMKVARENGIGIILIHTPDAAPGDRAFADDRRNDKEDVALLEDVAILDFSAPNTDLIFWLKSNTLGH